MSKVYSTIGQGNLKLLSVWVIRTIRVTIIGSNQVLFHFFIGNSL
jgi:hypothetical protein